MMPKGSEELINARKEEIIDACASLYETMGFNEITIRSIGKKLPLPALQYTTIFRPRKKSSLVCCGVSTKHGLLILKRSSAAK